MALLLQTILQVELTESLRLDKKAHPRRTHESRGCVPGMMTRHALQYLSIRLLLCLAVSCVLAATEVGAPAEYPAAGRRLLLLRLLEPEIPLALGPLDGDGLRVWPLGRPSRGTAAPQGDRRLEHGVEPGNAWLFQVFQLLCGELADRAGAPGNRRPVDPP